MQKLSYNFSPTPTDKICNNIRFFKNKISEFEDLKRYNEEPIFVDKIQKENENLNNTNDASHIVPINSINSPEKEQLNNQKQTKKLKKTNTHFLKIDVKEEEKPTQINRPEKREKKLNEVLQTSPRKIEVSCSNYENKTERSMMDQSHRSNTPFKSKQSDRTINIHEEQIGIRPSSNLHIKSSLFGQG
jgi:hypothetical protein